MGKLEEAIDAAQTWLDIPGVFLVGAGEDGGKPCLVVHAAKSREALGGAIPAEFRGFPVVIRKDTEPVPQ